MTISIEERLMLKRKELDQIAESQTRLTKANKGFGEEMSILCKRHADLLNEITQLDKQRESEG
ncbi:hypothetical protein [Klebsiella oxytoca]|uniref:hypothetical protein n=1 Tax=Klebsiella oxytoca TaxID=571 RepID=UPI00190EFB20|nr:hypothetical protein [Klebsiella oxytoca]